MAARSNPHLHPMHSSDFNLDVGGIRDSLSKVLDDKTYSDIIVKFGDHQVHAHKVILASRSRYFHRAFQGGFSVAISKVIDLGDDDDSEDVRRMLNFIYTGSCDRMTRSVPWEEIEFYMRMFILGDKYDIPSLREFAAKAWLVSAKRHTPLFAFPSIKSICGHSAECFADPLLQQTVMAYFREESAQILADPHMVRLLESGTLLNARFAGTAFVQLGARMKELEKEPDHKKFKTGTRKGAA